MIVCLRVGIDCHEIVMGLGFRPARRRQNRVVRADHDVLGQVKMKPASAGAVAGGSFTFPFAQQRLPFRRIAR